MKYLPTFVLACLLAISQANAQTLDETRASLHNAYDGLMQNLAEQEKLGQEITRLNNDITKQRKALEPDTQRVNELRAKVAAAEAAQSPDLQTAQMRLKVAEIEYRGLSEELTQQEKALADATDRMKTLEASTQSQIQKVQQLRQQVTSMAEKEKAATGQRDAARAAEIEQLKGELITLKINLQEAQAEQETWRNRATALQAEVEALKAQSSNPGGAPGAGMATAAVTTAVAGAATSSTSNAASAGADAATATVAAAAPAMTTDNSTSMPVETTGHDPAAELAARLKARNIDKATRKSGRYLYVKTVTAEGQTHSQAYPWLAVDRDYYTLEATMKAGEATLTYGNQRTTVTIPAGDDGATYVFVLDNATKDDAKLGYFRQ